MEKIIVHIHLFNKMILQSELCVGFSDLILQYSVPLRNTSFDFDKTSMDSFLCEQF